MEEKRDKGKAPVSRIISRASFPMAGAKASSSRKSKPATVCCMYTLQKNALILKWNRCRVQKFPKNSLFPSALK